MADQTSTPTFSTLLQRFFVEHLGRQRAVSPRTITAYRDTFRLLLSFAEARIGKAPTALALVDLDARLILSFLDHLEKDRKTVARSRKARQGRNSSRHEKTHRNRKCTGQIRSKMDTKNRLINTDTLAINRVADPGLEAQAGGRRR